MRSNESCARSDHSEALAYARSYLGGFLKILRLRLNKHATALGSLQRLPSKVGRRVTQEEIAEVVGVSRGWYRMLESDNTIRPSPRLLVRIANALMLSVSEQAHLFHLAFPELAVPETACTLCSDRFLRAARSFAMTSNSREIDRRRSSLRENSAMFEREGETMSFTY
jgi:transcriptional regulator with XRE-family HTH domain